MVERTQTVKVDLEIEEDKPRKFLVKTKMYIGDWYGADWDDVNRVVKGSVHSLTAFSGYNIIAVISLLKLKLFTNR
ncbi:hypothetical protein [Apibacter sp. B2912]|uniref:hypothetical protein n=1 Tax=Apibacter sp. B2912 TaxID=2656763 RepID=UPI00136EB862|nr:hypothetical protein [Apibacter sp. B2912]MXO33382.1 hypothetical protein [Apibacter sp. B2912]